MIRLQTPLVVAVQPFMRSQLLRACKNLHPVSMEQHLHSEPRITAWYGISVLIHNDRGIFVGPTTRGLYVAEYSFGKAKKMFFLIFV